MPVAENAPARSPVRAEVPDRYKWNLNDIFDTWVAWQAAYSELERGIDKYAQLKGTLAQGPAQLLATVAPGADPGAFSWPSSPGLSQGSTSRPAA